MSSGILLRRCFQNNSLYRSMSGQYMLIRTIYYVGLKNRMMHGSQFFITREKFMNQLVYVQKVQFFFFFAKLIWTARNLYFVLITLPIWICQTRFPAGFKGSFFAASEHWWDIHHWRIALCSCRQLFKSEGMYCFSTLNFIASFGTTLL